MKVPFLLKILFLLLCLNCAKTHKKRKVRSINQRNIRLDSAKMIKTPKVRSLNGGFLTFKQLILIAFSSQIAGLSFCFLLIIPKL